MHVYGKSGMNTCEHMWGSRCYTVPSQKVSVQMMFDNFKIQTINFINVFTKLKYCMVNHVILYIGTVRQKIFEGVNFHGFIQIAYLLCNVHGNKISSIWNVSQYIVQY